MAFLDNAFMLESSVAQKLYDEYANGAPIYDYHCHLDPQEIYNNENYRNLTHIWLGGDHYKWRLLRANGVPEELITGDGTYTGIIPGTDYTATNDGDFNKFMAFAGVMPKAIGNPIFEWSHLELQRFFGITTVLSPKTAREIYDAANVLLQTDAFKPRALMAKMNVKLIGTTDAPESDLAWHKKLAELHDFDCQVMPTFRPDGAFKIQGTDYADYLRLLGGLADITINNFADLIKVLDARVTYFATTVGGKLADAGMNDFYYTPATPAEIEAIFAKALKHEVITDHELRQFETELTLQLMQIYREHNWAMQIHMNCLRNVNEQALANIGADTGFDAVGNEPDMAGNIAQLYNEAVKRGGVPKSIWYSINAGDLAPLATVMGGFQGEANGTGNTPEGGYIQLGSGWWFLDTNSGMNHQLTTLGEQGLLGHFVGMLTDSRSFLSYPRHEYFRRVLCNYLANLVLTHRAPEDYELLGNLVTDIASQNIKQFLLGDAK
ncbi:MAG: glucuronate isomerase [Lactobacillaceae bacterium]|jgi:glucuronate isomerase|nr:glucuronate isomerase [Lactobacillaceae bacterium]